MPNAPTLSHSELLQLKRWNTPTIYNGWEQITAHDAATDAFNPEPTTDFMPQMGPMIGYATTLIVELSNKPTKTPKPGKTTVLISPASPARKSPSCRISTNPTSSAPSGAR